MIRGSLRNEVVEDCCRRCPKYDPGSTIHVTSVTTIFPPPIMQPPIVPYVQPPNVRPRRIIQAQHEEEMDRTIPEEEMDFDAEFFVTLWLRTSNTKVKVGKFEIEVENSVGNNVLQQCAKFGEERENIAVRNLLRVDAVAAAMT